MASIPVTTFSAARVHSTLAYQRANSRESSSRPLSRTCSPGPLGQADGHDQRPTLATYFMKNGQMFQQGTRTNPDGSTSCFATPVDGTKNLCSPSVIIHSNSFDPTKLTQAELKPVPSQSSPGIGPRKG